MAMRLINKPEVSDDFQPLPCPQTLNVVNISEDTVIITYCDGETCNLSHDLALFLREMGFSNVNVLVNGWTVWVENSLPVIKKENTADHE